MFDSDLKEFTALLDAVCSSITGGRYMPNELSTELFFNTLAEYPMREVRTAFTRHLCVSKFPPTPAELLSYLQAPDGRPGAEEAWAMALLAADEAATVVWTAEAAAAWDVARVVFDRGDEVGARMAFKEVYTKEVASARQAGIRPVWSASLGYDRARRGDALRVAMEKGLPMTCADHLLEMVEPLTPVALLEGPESGLPKALSPVARDAVQRMRALLRESRKPDESLDAAARRHTNELRAVSDARVDAYVAAAEKDTE